MSTLNTVTPQQAVKLQTTSKSFSKVTRKVGVTLGRILALLVALLLGMPVVLLPIATSVPAWLWILLALVDIGLLILPFRTMPVWRGMITSLSGAIMVSILAVLASQFFVSTPPITDANGQPIPGSIATLEKVSLN